jgi:hypothetical protein
MHLKSDYTIEFTKIMNQFQLIQTSFCSAMNVGLIVPVCEIEKEASIKDVVETSDNPFDSGKMFLGIDSRTSMGVRMLERKERQKQLDDIKDDDVKKELAKGNTLLSYIEHMPQ